MSRVCVVSLCLAAILATAPPASAQTNPGRRVTIDVTEVAPQQVFDLLAKALNCTFTVDPAVRKPLTLRVVDTPVVEILSMICRSIECEYRFDGKDYWIKPLSGARRKQAVAMEEYVTKLRSPLPQNMRFVDLPLLEVLAAIGKASGLELWPWRNETDRKVTIDVSGKTVYQALELIVKQVGGEGAVLIRSWQGSIAQLTVLHEPGKLDWPPSEWAAHVRALERRRK